MFMTLSQVREYLINEGICLYESIWNCDIKQIQDPIQQPADEADPVRILYNALMLYCNGEKVAPEDIILSLKESFAGAIIVFPSGKHLPFSDLLEVICIICDESETSDSENENLHGLLNKQLVAMARMSVNHGRRTVRYTKT